MKGIEKGEIVQVEGGHILRGTGRKDRHSKVYTAKGPRDRRVRLSAHTAIQFYDVQDRLGYDRPSKAVDWLIKKAQNAIDKLAELPPWNPNDSTTVAELPDLGSSSMAGIEPQQPDQSGSGYAFQLQKQIDENPNGNSSNASSFMADSMRSFFPTSSGASLMNFQNFPTAGSMQTEDLGLSLQPNSNPRVSGDQQVHYSGPFDANYSNHRNMGFIFSSQSISPYPLFCQNSAIQAQRESLQSNYSNLIHAWNNHNAQATNQSSLSSSHFASEFQVPARIQGDQEEPGVLPVRPSMSSPLSRY